jgi:hypothetical protein
MKRALAVVALFAVVAALSLASPSAHAADFPALSDGGSLITTVDAGFYAAVSTANTGGWGAAMRCSPFGVYYCASEGTCPGYCRATPSDGGFSRFSSGPCSGCDAGIWNNVVGTCTNLNGCSACPDDAGTCYSSACVPTQANLYLAPDVTYDIEMPGGYNQVGIRTFDGGTPACNLFKNRRRGE